VRAARAAARGEDSLARRHAALGLDELAQWQRSFGSLDLATSLVMHGGGLIFAGLRSAVRSGRPDIAFEWSERARQLGQQAIPVRPPRDEDLAADLAELRMLRLDSGPDHFLSHPRVAELSERVRSRQWSGSSAHGFRERVSLHQLRATLTADTAVVSFLYDGTAVAAVVASRAAARMVDLGPWTRIRPALAGLRADLDVSATVRSGPLAAIVAASLEERLAEISTILVDPLRASIAERRLVITVPGILGGIPWGMLPALRGRPITIAASAGQWSAAGRERAGMAPDVGFVAGPAVARGMEEVSRASSAWRAATVLDPAAATVDATGRLAARVGTLHIAAHGRHAADNPLFSGVELSDGTLFGYDLDLIAPVPQTVVLSACELGRSSVRWGEEAIGMTRAWLHAGARCVVASPAVVADDAACDLLAAMHTGLAAGMEVSEALCRAADRTGILAPFQVHGAGFSPRPAAALD
jgi:hypothetical protein